MLKNLLQFYLILATIAIIIGRVDFGIARKTGKPIFAPNFTASYYDDGGTVEWYGLGYKITEYNRMLRMTEFPREGMLYKVGAELTPWTIFSIPGVRVFLSSDLSGEGYYNEENEKAFEYVMYPPQQIRFIELLLNSIWDSLQWIVFIGLFFVYCMLKRVAVKRAQPVAGGDGSR